MPLLNSMGKIDTTTPHPFYSCNIIAVPILPLGIFLMMFLFVGAFGLKINFMAKAFYLEPFGSVLRNFGGLLIDRRKNQFGEITVVLIKTDFQLRQAIQVEGTSANSPY